MTVLTMVTTKVLSSASFLRFHFATRNLNFKIPILSFYESWGGNFWHEYHRNKIKWPSVRQENRPFLFTLKDKTVLSNSYQWPYIYEKYVYHWHLVRLVHSGTPSSALPLIQQRVQPQLLLFSCPVMSNSLLQHGLQYSRPPCPSLSPKVCSNSCPSSRWCRPTISSSVS